MGGRKVAPFSLIHQTEAITRMDTIVNYISSFFITTPAPEAAEPAPVPVAAEPKQEPVPAPAPAAAPPREPDVSICHTQGDTMWVISLSAVKKMTDRRQLLEIANEVRYFLMECYSSEESEKGERILAEIERILNTLP